MSPRSRRPIPNPHRLRGIERSRPRSRTPPYLPLPLPPAPFVIPLAPLPPLRLTLISHVPPHYRSRSYSPPFTSSLHSPPPYTSPTTPAPPHQPNHSTTRLLCTAAFQGLHQQGHTTPLKNHGIQFRQPSTFGGTNPDRKLHITCALKAP